MAANFSRATTLPFDVWSLIFEQLTNDYKPLCNIGLTCRDWRLLSLPHLLRSVDLSSHNNGRLPQHESEDLPIVYADYDAKYRQPNLVPRQRAFLRLITVRPELAKYVKSLRWTLIWLDFKERCLTDIDRQTWYVFSRMTNVSKLDFASLHDVSDDDYVRQNPSRLFPAVTHLRLLG